MFEVEKWVERDGQEFRIRCMDGYEELDLLGGLSVNDRIDAKRISRLLDACLLDWKNARSARGDELGDYAATKVRWLSAPVLDWLASEIMLLSQPTDDEKKTSSDSPSLDSKEASSHAAIAHV